MWRVLIEPLLQGSSVTILGIITLRLLHHLENLKYYYPEKSTIIAVIVEWDFMPSLIWLAVVFGDLQLFLINHDLLRWYSSVWTVSIFWDLSFPKACMAQYIADTYGYLIGIICSSGPLLDVSSSILKLDSPYIIICNCWYFSCQ